MFLSILILLHISDVYAILSEDKGARFVYFLLTLTFIVLMMVEEVVLFYLLHVSKIIIMLISEN